MPKGCLMSGHWNPTKKPMDIRGRVIGSLHIHKYSRNLVRDNPDRFVRVDREVSRQCGKVEIDQPIVWTP